MFNIIIYENYMLKAFGLNNKIIKVQYIGPQAYDNIS